MVSKNRITTKANNLSCSWMRRKSSGSFVFDAWSSWQTEMNLYEADTPEELLDFVQKVAGPIHSPELKPTDVKIAFGAKCSFPSLLLTRLKDSNPDIPFVRVTKADKADRVVVDTEDPCWSNYFDGGLKIIARWTDLAGVNHVGITTGMIGSYYAFSRGVGKYTYDAAARQEYNSSVRMLKQQLGAYKNLEIRACINISSQKEIDSKLAALQSSTPTVSTEVFTKAVWGYIPEMSEEEFEMAKKLLQSTEESNHALAFQTLQFSNFKKFLPQIVPLIYNPLVYGTATSAAAKFVKYLTHAQAFHVRGRSKLDWFEWAQTFDLYEPEEKTAMVKEQTRLLMLDLSTKYSTLLKSLNVHIECKGADGRTRKIDEYC